MRTVIAAVFLSGIGLYAQSFPSIAGGAPVYQSGTALNSGSVSTQMADYDPAHNQVLFYPYGSVSGSPLANDSILLIYHPGGSAGSYGDAFKNPANWVTVDLTVVTGKTYAWNFGGGFVDGIEPYNSLSNNPTYAYLVTGPRHQTGGVSAGAQGDITVQINLACIAGAAGYSGDTPSTSACYKYIDLGTVFTTAPLGGFSGVSDGTCNYYMPTVDAGSGLAHSHWIRYCPVNGAFGTGSSWQIYDLATIPQATSGPYDPQIGGMQSAAAVNGLVIAIPFFNGVTPWNGYPIAVDASGNVTQQTGYVGTAFTATAGGDNFASGFKMNLGTWNSGTSSCTLNGAYVPVASVTSATALVLSSVPSGYTGFNCYGMVTPASKMVIFNAASAGTGNTAFTTASNYTVFDITSLVAMGVVPSGLITQLSGLTGGIVVGNKVVFAPWGVRNTGTSNGVALIWDTTQSVTTAAAWKYIDLSTVTHTGFNSPAGYQFGWIDKWGYVWFVPTHNFNATVVPSMPPFICWNTALPFNSASSWKTFANWGFNGTANCSSGQSTGSGCGIWSTGGTAFNSTLNEVYIGTYGQSPSAATEVNYNLVLRESAPIGPGTGVSFSMAGKFAMSGEFAMGIAPLSPIAYVVPALPTVTAISTPPAVTGTTTAVHSGATLQAAIDAAGCGDQLVLDDEATSTLFNGNYVLRAKPSCTSWSQAVGIVSSGATNGSFPANGYRIAESQASLMAHICTTNSSPALANDGSGVTQYYYLVGIELSPCSTYTGGVYQQFFLGPNGGPFTPTTNPSTIAWPNHVAIFHSWIHGGYNQDEQQEGIIANANVFSLVDSIISDVQSTASDSTGLEIDCSPGDMLVQNNDIAAESEGVLMAAATCPAIPTNVKFLHNYNHKQINWTSSTPWTTYNGYLKNEFEVKNGQKLLYDQNICTANDAQGGQATACYTLTPRAETIVGPTTNCQYQYFTFVGDITITNTIDHDTGNGFEYGSGDNHCATAGDSLGSRVLISNMLIYNINVPGGQNYAATIDGSLDVTLMHSTLIDSNTAANCSLFANSTPMVHFTSYDNVTKNNFCGQGDGGPEALIGLNTHDPPANTPGAIVNTGAYGTGLYWNSSNVTVWGSEGAVNTLYDTSSNPFDSNYNILNTSPLYGLGFDSTKVNEAHVIAGVPN